MSKQVNSNHQEVHRTGTTVVITNINSNKISFESEEDAQKFFDIQEQIVSLQNEVNALQDKTNPIYDKLNILQRESFNLISDKEDENSPRTPY